MGIVGDTMDAMQQNNLYCLYSLEQISLANWNHLVITISNDVPLKCNFNPKLVKPGSPQTYFTVSQSYSNFAHRAAIILPFPAQTIIRLGKWNQYHEWARLLKVCVQQKFPYRMHRMFQSAAVIRLFGTKHSQTCHRTENENAICSLKTTLTFSDSNRNMYIKKIIFDFAIKHTAQYITSISYKAAQRIKGRWNSSWWTHFVIILRICSDVATIDTA